MRKTVRHPQQTFWVLALYYVIEILPVVCSTPFGGINAVPPHWGLFVKSSHAVIAVILLEILRFWDAVRITVLSSVKGAHFSPHK